MCSLLFHLRKLAVGMTVLVMACGTAVTSARREARPTSRSWSSTITFEEMQRRGQHSNLYVLVQDLRPRWLRSRGPDTFLGPQGSVQVHFDGNHLGSVEALRRLSAYGVTSIEWLPPIEAGARFGFAHSHGAIVVSTRVIH